MRIVLSDKDLDVRLFPSDVQVIKTDLKDLGKYNDNPNVIAIAGSRAMAIKAIDIEFPGLKLFQLTSAGFEGVPVEKYKDRGIAVANAGSIYSTPIAETVILGMLLMAKRLHKNPNNRHVKYRRHYDETITELADKKILILGTGNIGTAIASRLQGFEATVDGYNRTRKIKSEFVRIVSSRSELVNCIREYDYIISTLPDSNETRGLIDSELLNKMSSNAVIINVGRQSVFNEEDLYQALKGHRINGAVLDMFEKLPNPITNRFRRLQNVIVFPGVSAVSKEVNYRLRDYLVNNIKAALDGDVISNVINGER